MKYAIKYKVESINDNFDVLIPQCIERGNIEDSGEYFRTSKDLYCYITNPIIAEPYCVGNAYTMEELREQFGALPDDDDEDILEFFFESESDKLVLLCDQRRVIMDLFELFDDTSERSIYQNIEAETALLLNQNTFEILDGIQDIDLLKEKLNEFRDNLCNFSDEYVPDGVTAIKVKDGHVCEIDSVNKIKDIITSSVSEPVVDVNSDEFTVSGLYEYLKEHIIGHDKELKDIATILFLNRFSNPVYGTESILIPGPTGTGKTATFNVAARYLNVPFRNINTVNLVPDGIVGTTIEDEFASIIDECNGDQSKAEKALLVLDEFDKLGLQDLDIKTNMVDIFLKVLEGGVFPINRTMKATRYYNTLMATKICLGSFAEAYRKDKSIGFNTTGNKEEAFDRDLLIEKGYFSKELLTRIQHFIPYGDLTEEDKKRIILESKLSAYLGKKERMESQFGVEVIGDQSFAEGVLEQLKKDSKSLRDINNIIATSFLPIEYEVLSNRGKYKKLVLSNETVTNGIYDLSK